jgi:molecular chaperone Hsp33
MATSGERYQGIVPLEGNGLADAAAHYFEQSEQIPSFLRVGVRHDKGAGCLAGGVLVQHLPEGEVGRDRLHVRHDHPEWEHALAIVRTLSTAELTDPAIGLDMLAWRLFHEDEVRVELGEALTRGCRCSTEHFESVLRQFPDADRADMADDQGVIAVDCAFCSRIFPIEASKLVTH